MWVNEAIAHLAGRAALRQSAWRHIRVSAAAWDGVFAAAEAHNAEGTLFRRAQHGRVPEDGPPDGPVPADVPDAADPASECEDGSLDGAGDNEVALFPADAPGDAGEEEEEVAGAAPAAAEGEAAPAVVQDSPGVAGGRDLALLERVLALRLVYGRGPPGAC